MDGLLRRRNRGEGVKQKESRQQNGRKGGAQLSQERPPLLHYPTRAKDREAQCHWCGRLFRLALVHANSVERRAIVSLLQTRGLPVRMGARSASDAMNTPVEALIGWPRACPAWPAHRFRRCNSAGPRSYSERTFRRHCPDRPAANRARGQIHGAM